ncbi:cell division control protein Cdc6 [Acidiplasma aeolicum]|uniref:ORC1-type DNA replication protein n=1 Tax=Acidiplasma aeolicum TaxID=507754 RepID=A0A0Q0XIJ6_9ARCH|nr:ORC1-type DNA replication protein [Acidiplasma aeolicum]KPV46524.1 cell division control protein Cdc6 [Acidiplasma aeolicum]KQB34586.1 cell division control protein Cdc6 [Acidiplasma aeolicum]
MDNPFIKYSKTSDYVIGDLKKLSSSYIPDNFPHREKQINEIAKILSSIINGGIASNILIYGKSGSGKTSSTLYVTSMLSEAVSGNLNSIYINCEIYDSQYSILINIINSINIGETQVPSLGLPLDRVYFELIRRLKKSGKYTIIILDEIDKLIQKNGSDALYVILKVISEVNASIIGITNDSSFVNRLDARVQSRLNQESIIFPPYNAIELRDILNFRVSGIIKREFIDDSAINLCAALGAQEHGDARKSIDLLRIAIENALREGRDLVTADDVYRARDKFEMNILKESIKTLPIHSKMVLLSAALTQETDSDLTVTGEIYENYKNISTELGFQPLTMRRISDLLTDLEDLGLLSTNTRSLGRYGRTKFIRVMGSIENIKSYIMEDPAFINFQGSKIVKQTKLRTNFDSYFDGLNENNNK